MRAASCCAWCGVGTALETGGTLWAICLCPQADRREKGGNPPSRGLAPVLSRGNLTRLLRGQNVKSLRAHRQTGAANPQTHLLALDLVKKSCVNFGLVGLEWWPGTKSNWRRDLKTTWDVLALWPLCSGSRGIESAPTP